jgi:hypothetical protein
MKKLLVIMLVFVLLGCHEKQNLKKQSITPPNFTAFVSDTTINYGYSDHDHVIVVVDKDDFEDGSRIHVLRRQDCGNFTSLSEFRVEEKLRDTIREVWSSTIAFKHKNGICILNFGEDYVEKIGKDSILFLRIDYVATGLCLSCENKEERDCEEKIGVHHDYNYKEEKVIFSRPLVML